MKIIIRLVLFLLIIAVLVIVSLFISIPYNINTKGLVKPYREWTLVKLSDGTILDSQRNNLTNNLSSYSALEFPRGDMAEFIVNPLIFNSQTVEAGDTVGFIKSWEEERRLLQFKGELEAQKRLLFVLMTGEKESEIKAAKEKVVLTEKEYETQLKLIERVKNLHQQGVVADEEYDLAYNQYQIKKQNIEIAKSILEVVSSGAKPEELNLIRTKIDFLIRQIEQTENRIDAFNITAPFSGVIIREQVPEVENQTILKVVDNQMVLITLPVELHQLPYIKRGLQVNLRVNGGLTRVMAEIVDIDNSVQFIDQRQHLFVTAIVTDDATKLMPNMLVQAEILCGEITVRQFLARASKIVFAN